MKVVGIIPSRYKSSRFEGKPLAIIAGKTMIRRVYEQAQKAKKIDKIYVATDDNRIRSEAESFGARVIMTSPDHASGTDRVAEAIYNIDCDIVINIQGDEPLINPEVLDALAIAMINEPDIPMATLIIPITDMKVVQDPNVSKVVKDKNGFALYCSRAAIPFARDGNWTNVYKQLGIYAYRRDFLLKFASMGCSAYENIEKLEQLRALENGYKLKTVETKYDSIGVDIPEDVKKVERLLEKQHL